MLYNGTAQPLRNVDYTNYAQFPFTYNFPVIPNAFYGIGGPGLDPAQNGGMSGIRIGMGPTDNPTDKITFVLEVPSNASVTIAADNGGSEVGSSTAVMGCNQPCWYIAEEQVYVTTTATASSTGSLNDMGQPYLYYWGGITISFN